MKTFLMNTLRVESYYEKIVCFNEVKISFLTTSKSCETRLFIKVKELKLDLF